MADPSTRHVTSDDETPPRKWAPIRFPAAAAHPDDATQTRCRRIYELQRGDDERFDFAVPELLDRLDLSGGSVVAMTCDSRFSQLLENWVAACDHFGIDCRASTLVFPTDRRAFDRAETLGLVAFFDGESQLLREMGESRRYGDLEWTQYMFHQNWVIRRMLELPADLLFQDVDVVWRRNPLPYLREQAATGADIQAMYDGPNPRFQPLYANSGFLYLRNTPDVRSFWGQVYERHDMVAFFRSQQEPFNVLLAAHAHRGLDVRVLDEERFANGHRYCGPRTPPDDPWVIHNSWTEDLAEKLVRYHAHGLWFV